MSARIDPAEHASGDDRRAGGIPRLTSASRASRRARGGCSRRARIVRMPAVVSEQYPRGLGASAPELGIAGETVLAKTCFSAAAADGFDSGGCAHAILCGIETHVCVEHTARDLLGRGVNVHVVADACGSRHEIDCRVGAARACVTRGAVVETVESVALRALRRLGQPRVQAGPGARRSERAPRLRAARGRRPLRRGALRRRPAVTGEVVFKTGMSGYQESMTDPSYARPADRLHLPAHRQLRGQRARRWSPSARGRARGDHARRPQPRGRRQRRGRLARLADRLRCRRRSAASTPARWSAHPRAGAMRGGIFPAEHAASEAASCRRRAADGRPRPRARRHAARVEPATATATARTSP